MRKPKHIWEGRPTPRTPSLGQPRGQGGHLPVVAHQAQDTGVSQSRALAEAASLAAVKEKKNPCQVLLWVTHLSES